MTDYFSESRRAFARFVFWAAVAAIACSGWMLFRELSELAEPLSEIRQSVEQEHEQSN